MPATTRSKTQTKLEDKGIDTNKASTKRKAPASKSATPAKKPKTKAAENEKPSDKTKTEDDDQPSEESSAAESSSKNDQEDKDNDAQDSNIIIINRAPVLELWSACLTSFLHPNLAWETCLSIGSAISTLGAIAKGRSIGTIPAPSQAKDNSTKSTPQDESEQEELQIMSFTIHLKDGKAMVSGKTKPGKEETLSKKFGERYEDVKTTMRDALANWEGKGEELNGRAFHMYEDFRPNVSAGQKGWGRKGILSLEKIKEVVKAG